MKKKGTSQKVKENYLKRLYYDTPYAGSLGGVEKLNRKVKADDKYTISRGFIKNWLSSQDAYTLHKPVKKRWKRNRVYVRHIDDQWEVDLVDMSNISRTNDRYRYILTCIDVLSKFAFAVPLKTKSSQEVLSAFAQCITESGRQPKKLHSDEGTEFMNHTFQHYLKDKGIHHFITRNKDIKAAIVERFNRTLRSHM